jgi:ATP-binding cassette subfamily F protein 3
LAKLALEDTNLLLLDEPTNHLDIPSQEILEAVLDDYSGTILLVTHDRYLIDALATQIWEIDPQETTLDIFVGTYSQRREERERLAAQRMADEASKAVTKRSLFKRSGDPAAREERRKVARMQELENKIAAIETQMAEIGRKLETPPADTALVRKWGNQYATLQIEMDQWLEEWENLQV